ncbi:MAG: hypothetical protein JXB36_20790 [Gammaproteobacteria bacterium]|nr:hypothetical protein [Gammaproteobacteria bacterium]
MNTITRTAVSIALYGIACGLPQIAAAADADDGAASVRTAAAAQGGFDTELLALQREWAEALYRTTDGKARKSAFEALQGRADELAERYPRRVEAVAWRGIVLSTFAGEVGGMSAMKYAKAARKALHEAESIDPAALDGGIYASLGALYSKVPGGIIGFGDDDLAEGYFRKALTVDPGNIDANFFYGEFLLEHGDTDGAVERLERALDAPAVEARPIFDAGRRAEIRSLLQQASKSRRG